MSTPKTSPKRPSKKKLTRLSAMEFQSTIVGNLPQFTSTSADRRELLSLAKSRKNKRASSTTSEHYEQVMLMKWARTMHGMRGFDGIELLHAIPNGGYRCRATAGKMKAEGQKAGVSDLFLPVARNRKHGLYIEMKAASGLLSAEQAEWLAAVRKQGYAGEVCYGNLEARQVITNYLTGGSK